ncbi:MAG TPA: hypothetical protein VGL77_10755 [Armatimonadota bacterium]
MWIITYTIFMLIELVMGVLLAKNNGLSITGLLLIAILTSVLGVYVMVLAIHSGPIKYVIGNFGVVNAVMLAMIIVLFIITVVFDYNLDIIIRLKLYYSAVIFVQALSVLVNRIYLSKLMKNKPTLETK